MANPAPAPGHSDLPRQQGNRRSWLRDCVLGAAVSFAGQPVLLGGMSWFLHATQGPGPIGDSHAWDGLGAVVVVELVIVLSCLSIAALALYDRRWWLSASVLVAYPVSVLVWIWVIQLLV